MLDSGTSLVIDVCKMMALAAASDQPLAVITITHATVKARSQLWLTCDAPPSRTVGLASGARILIADSAFDNAMLGFGNITGAVGTTVVNCTFNPVDWDERD